MHDCVQSECSMPKSSMRTEQCAYHYDMEESTETGKMNLGQYKNLVQGPAITTAQWPGNIQASLNHSIR